MKLGKELLRTLTHLSLIWHYGPLKYSCDEDLKRIFLSKIKFLKTDFFAFFAFLLMLAAFIRDLFYYYPPSIHFFSQTFFLKRHDNNNSNNGSCQVQIYPQKRQICHRPALFESLPVTLFKSRVGFRFRDRKFKNAFQPVTAKTFDFRSSCNGRWPRRLKRPERPELR